MMVWDVEAYDDGQDRMSQTPDPDIVLEEMKAQRQRENEEEPLNNGEEQAGNGTRTQPKSFRGQGTRPVMGSAEVG